MLIATDASNRPVFDNSAESDLVAWTMESTWRGFKRNHQFINLEFVNTKLVIDKAEVKVRGMHTCKLVLVRYLRCVPRSRNRSRVASLAEASRNRRGASTV